MPTYPYNDTPQATQRKNATQPLIKTNFLSINSTITQEHLPINDPGANAGKHKQVTFTNVAAPAFGATEIGIYNNNASGAQELYVKKAGGTGYPFTAGNLATIGWTRLPSGLLIKWGNANATAGLYTYTFPVGATIPAFTTIYSINITTYYIMATENTDGNGFVRLSRFAAPWTSFNVYASYRTLTTPAAVSFQYLAIGI